eukprot:GHUV01045797.1.p1 GENE.GHUV01045797.1~~GHUV01045797.1.p1  ORF type:complete len:441 (+),score=116.28 GHUV01045797.1:347-1669(+)
MPLTEAAGSVVPNGNRPLRWSRDKLARIEDLELALDAAVHVNRHLNKEIEGLIQQIERERQQRLAWEEQAKRLAQQLSQHKRAAGQTSKQHNYDGQHQQDPDSTGDAAPLQRQQQLPDRAVSPEAFPWESMYDDINRLVQKGHDAGWLAQPSDVQLGDLLGQGAFGTTYKAYWHGAQVAVKQVLVRSETELLNFLREVECLAALRHPNVVPFLGAVLQDQGRCWLISEYMSGGTLAKWLHGDKGPFGPNKTLLQRAEKALEVCRALAALDACNPTLLHRDVKPSNIFIDAAGAARLGDFGLARPLPSSKNTLTGETGTYLYMSPEMIRHDWYDTKTDVWSFGVLLAELLTGQIPYQHTFMTPVQIAMGVADEKLQPLLPSDAPTDLVVLARICCDYDPDMRPSFGEVVPQLEATVAELRVGERGSLRHRSSSPAWGGCSG